MNRRSAAVVVVALLVAAGLVAATIVPALLSARGGGGERDDAVEEPAWTLEPVALEPAPGLAVPDGLEEFYSQDLAWTGCGRFECATLAVPMDYDDPDGRRLDIAVLRVAAGDPDQRLGSLVVNPGGPGASGTQFAAQSQLVLSDQLRRHYDVVGFDPRGVGGSTAVDCVDDATLDEIVAADPTPDSPEEERELERLGELFAQGCLDSDAELLRHVSTVEAARDVDVLRAALDEDRLTWFGASYGTHLGAQYADLFPERVGRMVLDGAVDPTLPLRERALAQARGFETALRAYAEDCVAGPGCYLGEDVDAATGQVAELVSSLGDEPLTVGDRELTEGLAFYGLIAPLYDRGYWSYLDLALQGVQRGDGQLLLALSDAYTSRGPDGSYSANTMEAIVAIRCLDDPRFVPSDRVERSYAAFEQASPTFGRVFADGLAGCQDWPVQGEGPPDALVAAGAEPILVTGTTRDPATPLEWAESLSAQLESAVLLRRDGDGHTAYGAGNACVDETVERYLVEGAVPTGTVDC